MKTKFILIALALTLAHTITAATYYVDYVRGSDSNSGTAKTAPWRHCPGDPEASGKPKAVKLAGGDVIRFNGNSVYGGRLVIARSGSPGLPIVYDGTGKVYGTQRAVIDRQYKLEAAITFNAGISHVSILGFEIRNVGGYPDNSPVLSQTLAQGAVTKPPWGLGIDVRKGGNAFLSLEGLFMHRIGQWRNQEPFSGANSISGVGIELQNVTNVVIRGCEFTKMRVPISIKATTCTDGVTVDGCDLHEYFVWGIDIAPRKAGAALKNIEVKRTTIRDYHQYDSGNWLGGGEKPHTDGIFIRTAGMRSTWEKVSVHSCRFTTDDAGASKGGTASIYVSQGPSVNIFNNVLINDRHSRSIYVGGKVPLGNAKQVVRIMNNTLVGCPPVAKTSETNALRCEVYVLGNLFYRSTGADNNVFVNQESALPFTALDGNVYFNTQYLEKKQYVVKTLKTYLHLTTPLSIQSKGQDLNSVYADPLFVAPDGVASVKNVRVQAGSPAAGRGPNLSEYFREDADGNLRPAVGLWTAGAFQLP